MQSHEQAARGLVDDGVVRIWGRGDGPGDSLQGEIERGDGVGLTIGDVGALETRRDRQRPGTGLRGQQGADRGPGRSGRRVARAGGPTRGRRARGEAGEERDEGDTDAGQRTFLRVGIGADVRRAAGGRTIARLPARWQWGGRGRVRPRTEHGVGEASRPAGRWTNAPGSPGGASSGPRRWVRRSDRRVARLRGRRRGERG